jgi:hypothetical protein
LKTDISFDWIGIHKNGLKRDMKVIYAPNKIPRDRGSEGFMLFLAGSIEMGTAEDWQTRVIQYLADKPITLLNPRRLDWNGSWEQKIENDKFREQVEWELDALEMSDKILFYFAPATKSPISLLELGLYARSGKAVVCCPDGFWRKGNVDIVCKKYNIPQIKHLEDIKDLI